MCKRIEFSPPDISEAEIKEVVDALQSGWITTGPKTKELERRIAEYIGTAKCVCLNSQTACAEMVLRILGIGEGDEVIVPPLTMSSTTFSSASAAFISSKHVPLRSAAFETGKSKQGTASSRDS